MHNRIARYFEDEPNKDAEHAREAGELLSKLGVDDPVAYVAMSDEQRRAHHAARLARWMAGEEL